MSTQGPCSESIDNVGVCICAAVERCAAIAAASPMTAAAAAARMPAMPTLGDVFVTSKRGMLFLQHRWTRQLLLRPRHATAASSSPSSTTLAPPAADTTTSVDGAAAASSSLSSSQSWPRQRWVRGVLSIQSRSFERDAPLTFTTSPDNMVSDMADEKDGDDEQVWCLAFDTHHVDDEERSRDVHAAAATDAATAASSASQTRQPQPLPRAPSPCSRASSTRVRVCVRAVPVLLPPYNSSSSRSARLLFWYEQLLQQQQLMQYQHEQQQRQQRALHGYIDQQLLQQEQQQQQQQQGHSARATAATCAMIMRAREAVLLRDVLQTINRLLQHMPRSSRDDRSTDTTYSRRTCSSSSGGDNNTTNNDDEEGGGEDNNNDATEDGADSDSNDDDDDEAHVCSIDVPVYTARVAATDNAATRLRELAPYTDAFLRACVVHDDGGYSDDASAVDATTASSLTRDGCVLVHDSTCALAVLCDCLDVLATCASATTTTTTTQDGSHAGKQTAEEDDDGVSSRRQAAVARVHTVLVALRAFVACACREAEAQLDQSSCDVRSSNEHDGNTTIDGSSSSSSGGDADGNKASAQRRVCEEQLIAALHDTGIARGVAVTRSSSSSKDAHAPPARRFAPASGVLVHCTRGESRSVTIVLLFFLRLMRPLLRRLHQHAMDAALARYGARGTDEDGDVHTINNSDGCSNDTGSTATTTTATTATTAGDTSALYDDVSIVWLLQALRVARPSARPHIAFMAEANALWHRLIECGSNNSSMPHRSSDGVVCGDADCVYCCDDVCTCDDARGVMY